MFRPLLRRWRAAEAASLRLFHAVVASTPPPGLNAAPLASRASMDANMTSMLCLMLPVKKRQDEDCVTDLKRKRRAAPPTSGCGP